MTAARTANQMRLQAAMLLGQVGKPKFGTVTSYDPDNYLVKVTLQPEGIETGWLPIEVLQAGTGWGVYAAPQLGDQAVVHFHEADKEQGWCAGFLPNDVDTPPHVPAGEIHLINKGGQFVKLITDGTISMQSGSGSNVAYIKLNPDGTISSKGPWLHDDTFRATKAVTFDDALSVAGAVSFTGSSVTHGGVNIGKTHVHTDPQGGVTGGPS